MSLQSWDYLEILLTLLAPPQLHQPQMLAVQCTLASACFGLAVSVFWPGCQHALAWLSACFGLAVSVFWPGCQRTLAWLSACFGLASAA